VATFETVLIGELKHRLPAKLLPLVEEYREKLEKLTAEQGGVSPSRRAMTPRNSAEPRRGQLVPSSGGSGSHSVELRRGGGGRGRRAPKRMGTWEP
jgi:hypothetical protein